MKLNREANILFNCLVFASSGQASAFTVAKNTFGNARANSSALKMSTIESVKAREILDSRGNPTVEV